MRKSKQGKYKKTSGTNLKVSPLKRFKKQVKRMKNNIRKLNDNIDFSQITEGPMVDLKKKYETRLEGAELHLKNYDKEQEQKKADEMKAAALLKKKV